MLLVRMVINLNLILDSHYMFMNVNRLLIVEVVQQMILLMDVKIVKQEIYSEAKMEKLIKLDV